MAFVQQADNSDINNYKSDTNIQPNENPPKNPLKRPISSETKEKLQIRTRDTRAIIQSQKQKITKMSEFNKKLREQ